MDDPLKKMSQVALVNPSGELVVNAGRFARGAILMAYEMIGGTEALAEWADENRGEFYTKMFAKVVGREVEHTASDSVEALLEKLDQGVLNSQIIDVTPQDIEDAVVETATEKPKSRKGALIRAAKMYAEGEPDEEDD